MTPPEKNVLEDYLESLLRSEALPMPDETPVAPIVSAVHRPSEEATQRDCSSTIVPVVFSRSEHLSAAKTAVPELPVLVSLQAPYMLEEARRNELQALLSRQVFFNHALTEASTEPKVKIDAKVLESEPEPEPEPEPAHFQVSKVSSPSPLADIAVEGSIAAEPVASLEGATEKAKPQCLEVRHASAQQKQKLTLSTVLPPEPWADNGRPSWGQQPFHALLFKVSGLTLAVPLVTLGQIHTITGKITPLLGQAEWFMGLQETNKGRVQVINTALYVMPERYNPSFVETAKYVISIEGLNWGLAVDEVQQPTELNPEDVTWRAQRTSRPWLAGTVKSAMCALLDIPQMGYLLESTQMTKI